MLRRLAGFVATLLVASAIVFVLLDLLPGDAAEAQLGTTATPEAVAALRASLGLDRPPIERYGAWISGLAHGDLGLSSSYGAPVADLVAERLAVTLPLAAMAMAMTVVAALSLGLFAASHHGRPGDLAVTTLSQVGLAVPGFWLAILLVLVFAVKLHWFAAGGFPGWDDSVLAGLKALLLPAIALAAVQTAVLTRVTRGALLDVLQDDFVRTARAKGLTRGQALRRHVLRNAFVPVLTVMGLQFANLVTGTVVIENVFNLPGLGRLTFQAIANRDLVVLRSVVMLFAAAVITINLFVDLIQAGVDPRLREQL